MSSSNVRQTTLYTRAARILAAMKMTRIDKSNERQWILGISEEVDKARDCFTRGEVKDMKIPRIVLTLAAKFQLKSDTEISLDELLTESPIVNTFLQKCVWRDSIIEDSAIPGSTHLLDISTHWWTTFQPAPAIPPPNLPGKRVTKVPLAPAIPPSNLPGKHVAEVPPRTTIAPRNARPVNLHTRNVSGIKRPSPSDSRDDSEDEGNMNLDDQLPTPHLKETKKRRKVTADTAEGMQFRPGCNLCRTKDQPCVVSFSKLNKIKPCKACINRKVKCSASEDLPDIIDADGEVIHAAKSWGHLNSRSGKGKEDLPEKVNPKALKGKGKAQDESSEHDHVRQLAIHPGPSLPEGSKKPPVINLESMDMDVDVPEGPAAASEPRVNEKKSSKALPPMDADQLNKMTELDRKVRELDLSIARFNLETDDMRTELDRQQSDVAALKDRLQARVSAAGLQEHDWHRMVDVLQSAIQQDTTVHENLRHDVTAMKTVSMQADNQLLAFNHKVGELMHHSVQSHSSHTLPMPADWVPGGSGSSS